jgi:hypothetical protein
MVMAQKEPRNDEGAEKVSAFNLLPTELAKMGTKRIEDFVNAQAELLVKLQESNKQWFDRVQSEANLVSDLASKLTSARSIPDAMSAYQEWGTRKLEMMAEDGKHALADAQKFVETGARLLSNGWQSNGKGAALST